MRAYTIKPLVWEEIETDYETALTENSTYEVFDNEKFPPTSHNGGQYLTPPAKSFGATGNNMESSFHGTIEQAKAACEADWQKRIGEALVEADGWLDIESATEDDTLVDLWFPGHDGHAGFRKANLQKYDFSKLVTAAQAHIKDWWIDPDTDEIYHSPSHFMLPPKPPKGE